MLPLDKKVTVRQLIKWAGQFNEEMREGAGPEYTRGQVELICDAAGIPQDERQVVIDAMQRESDLFFRS